MKKCIEVSQFKAKNGISKEQILQIANEMTPKIATLDGFVSRKLNYNQKDDSFVCIIEWENEQKAHKAMEDMMQSQEGGKLFVLLDESSLDMKLLDLEIES
jgi:heme-degrading monooxygenase HmoA